MGLFFRLAVDSVCGEGGKPSLWRKMMVHMVMFPTVARNPEQKLLLYI